MKDVKIPCIFYLYLHSKLWEMTKGEVVSEKDIKKMLFQWKIPTNLRILIIKEMQILGLIEKEKRFNLKLNRPKFNEENINKYYRLLKVF